MQSHYHLLFCFPLLKRHGGAAYSEPALLLVARRDGYFEIGEDQQVHHHGEAAEEQVAEGALKPTSMPSRGFTGYSSSLQLWRRLHIGWDGDGSGRIDVRS